MLLCNCKAKIKKVSTDFAIALLSARLEQAVCYRLATTHSLLKRQVVGLIFDQRSAMLAYEDAAPVVS